MTKIFKSSDICKLFHVSRATVNNWVNTGLLPAHKTLGGHCRFMYEDLIDFINKKGLPIPDEIKIRKHKILIVDDENSVIESVKTILETIGIDIEIETAKDGITAGIKLTQFRPDLVILDAIMPGANGDIVCKTIKQNETLKKIKILIYTGYPQEGEKLLQLGADTVIEKFSSKDNPEVFKKVVLKLLGIKYYKVLT